MREDPLIVIEVASTGQYIMTCTAKNEVDILSLNGTVLASFVNNQVETYFAKISPDGKLVGTSGIASHFTFHQHAEFPCILPCLILFQSLNIDNNYRLCSSMACKCFFVFHLTSNSMISMLNASTSG